MSLLVGDSSGDPRLFLLLSRELVENLLQRCLRDGVLLDVQGLFAALHKTEHGYKNDSDGSNVSLR